MPCGTEAQSGASCHRALRRGGPRGLPAVHLDRGRRHAVGRSRASSPPRRASSRSSGTSSAGYQGDSYGSGLRFKLGDRDGTADDGHRSSTRDRSPTSSGPSARSRQGRAPERRLRREEGLARDEVPVEVHGQEELVTCLSWAAPRCSPRSASPSTRSLRARSRPGSGRRRLAVSARNASSAPSSRPPSPPRPARRARPPRLLVRLRRAAHEPRAADALHDLRVLGRAGGLAAPLAARS